MIHQNHRLNNSNENIHQSLKQLKDNWYWYFILGLSLVAAGALAIIYSVTSTIFSVIFLGGLLIVLGIIETVHSFKLSKWGNFLLHLALGILMAIAGIFILNNPLLNALTLTLLFAGIFIVSGIFKIIFSIFGHTAHKGILFLNGLISFVLGILLWQQWPISGLWAIGTFVGIDAIITGWTWIFLSLKAKRIKSV